ERALFCQAGLRALSWDRYTGCESSHVVTMDRRCTRKLRPERGSLLNESAMLRTPGSPPKVFATRSPGVRLTRYASCGLSISITQQTACSTGGCRRWVCAESGSVLPVVPRRRRSDGPPSPSPARGGSDCVRHCRDGNFPSRICLAAGSTGCERSIRFEHQPECT